MRLAPAAVALAFAAALGSACGGIEHEPNLAIAVERTEETGSSRIEARTNEGSEGGIADRCEGVADYARKRLEISCTYRGEPVMTMRVVDGFLYFKQFGETDKWWREKEDDDNPISNLSPDSLFALLRDASSETVRVGEEDVRGVSTVRYRLTVDRERAELGDGPGEAQVDVWLDHDGLLRRVAADADGEAFTMDFYDFGVEVDVQPPPSNHVVELEELVREKPCAPGDERPIRVGRALDGLRAHGFDVASEQECLAGRVGQLTNLSDDVDDLDALIRDDGYLTCDVFLTDDATTHTLTLGPPAGAGADGPRTETRTVRNLQCTIILEGAKGKGHLERLDTALAELKRAVGP